MKVVKGFFYKDQEYIKVFESNGLIFLSNEKNSVLLVCTKELDIKFITTANCGQNIGYMDYEEIK